MLRETILSSNSVEKTKEMTLDVPQSELATVFTAQMDALICRQYPNTATKAIAEMLQTSPTAIRNRARMLGVRKNERFIAPAPKQPKMERPAAAYTNKGYWQVCMRDDMSDGCNDPRGEVDARADRIMASEAMPQSATATDSPESYHAGLETGTALAYPVQQIIAASAWALAVPEADISDGSRMATRVLARHIVMYLLRCKGWSLRKVAMRLKRDERTVAYGYKRIAMGLRAEEDVVAAMQRVFGYLKGAV
jgi:hypothetical protein